MDIDVFRSYDHGCEGGLRFLTSNLKENLNCSLSIECCRLGTPGKEHTSYMKIGLALSSLYENYVSTMTAMRNRKMPIAELCQICHDWQVP